MKHAFTLAYALFSAALVSFLLHRDEDVRALSEELHALGTREGFALYIANGLVLKGWSTGQVSLIQQGVSLLPRSSLSSFLPACSPICS